MIRCEPQTPEGLIVTFDQTDDGPVNVVIGERAFVFSTQELSSLFYSLAQVVADANRNPNPPGPRSSEPDSRIPNG